LSWSDFTHHLGWWVGDPLGFDARGDWKDTLVPNQYINLPLTSQSPYIVR